MHIQYILLNIVNNLMRFDICIDHKSITIIKKHI